MNYNLIQNLGIAAAAFILLALLFFSAVNAHESKEQLETCQQAVELADEIIQHAGDGFAAVRDGNVQGVNNTADNISRVAPEYREAHAECQGEN